MSTTPDNAAAARRWLDYALVSLRTHISTNSVDPDDALRLAGVYAQLAALDAESDTAARLLRLERDGSRDNANRLGGAATGLRAAARAAAADLNAALNDPNGHDLTLAATRAVAALDRAADTWLSEQTTDPRGQMR